MRKSWWRRTRSRFGGAGKSTAEPLCLFQWERDVERERGACTRSGLDQNPSAVLARDLIPDGEAEAGAAAFLREERLENPIEHVVRNSGPRSRTNNAAKRSGCSIRRATNGSVSARAAPRLSTARAAVASRAFVSRFVITCASFDGSRGGRTTLEAANRRYACIRIDPKKDRVSLVAVVCE